MQREHITRKSFLDKKEVFSKASVLTISYLCCDHYLRRRRRRRPHAQNPSFPLLIFFIFFSSSWPLLADFKVFSTEYK